MPIELAKRRRYSIDKVYINFNVGIFDVPIDHSIFAKELKLNLKLSSTDPDIYRKFGMNPGLKHNDFFDRWKDSWYRPLISNVERDKVICWLIIDYETYNAVGYVNCNELYMKKHNIPSPKVVVSDKNYIPEDHPFSIFDIIDVLHQATNLMLTWYDKDIESWDDKMVPIPETTFRSLEFCKEYLNTNSFAISQYFLKQDIVNNMNKHNATIYVNHKLKSMKHQWKAYEKTPSLLRCEYTFHSIKYPNNSQDLFLYLQQLTEIVDSEFGTDKIFMDIPQLEKSEIYNMYIKYFSGRTTNSFRDADLFYLLSRNTYEFNATQEALKKRLQRRKLITKSTKRGTYEPTQKLQQVKDAFNFYFSNMTETNKINQEIEDFDPTQEEFSFLVSFDEDVL